MSTSKDDYDFKKLRLPRYLLAIKYPNCGADINEEVNPRPEQVAEYPHLYRRVKWYVGRTTDLNLMTSIKFVKVNKTSGNFTEGAIYPVYGYRFKEINPNIAVDAFYIGNLSNPFPLDFIEPSFKSEYEEFIKKTK